MSARSDSLTQNLIRFRHQQHSVNVGPQCVGKGEHPLEVSEADAGAAVGAEQRPRRHEATARAAAHA